jgi:hypothetical protein
MKSNLLNTPSLADVNALLDALFTPLREKSPLVTGLQGSRGYGGCL